MKRHRTEVVEEYPECQWGVQPKGNPWIWGWITAENIGVKIKGKKAMIDIAVEVDDSLLSPADASLIQIMKLSQKQDIVVMWDFKCLDTCWNSCFAKSNKSHKVHIGRWCVLLNDVIPMCVNVLQDRPNLQSHSDFCTPGIAISSTQNPWPCPLLYWFLLTPGSFLRR